MGNEPSVEVLWSTTSPRPLAHAGRGPAHPDTAVVGHRRRDARKRRRRRDVLLVRLRGNGHLSRDPRSGRVRHRQPALRVDDGRPLGRAGPAGQRAGRLGRPALRAEPRRERRALDQPVAAMGRRQGRRDAGLRLGQLPLQLGKRPHRTRLPPSLPSSSQALTEKRVWPHILHYIKCDIRKYGRRVEKGRQCPNARRGRSVPTLLGSRS